MQNYLTNFGEFNVMPYQQRMLLKYSVLLKGQTCKSKMEIETLLKITNKLAIAFIIEK